MGDFLRVKKSVKDLESLLNLRLRPFQHKAGRMFSSTWHKSRSKSIALRNKKHRSTLCFRPGSVDKKEELPLRY